jgi:anthranilate phosphoribosyltransferase
MRDFFRQVMAGEVDPIVLSGILVALKAKGETPEEIAGAAEALREEALPFDCGGLAVADTCGTGGDGAGTVNISTAVAIVAAEMGIPMAKHGNRSVSSRCGSADVLEKCGIRIDAATSVSEGCLRELGIAFLFAPQFHAGVRHAMPVRRALRTRTLFNIIGPLANPARPSWQLLGVYDERLCRPIAETLALLGSEAALVVNGGGLDEIAIHTPTRGARLYQGRVEDILIDPVDYCQAKRSIGDLQGGEPEQNARWLKQLLRGEATDAHNEAVAINAGATAWVAGRSSDLKEGTKQALDSLKSGRGLILLEKWAELSHGA